jgi:hypothetical protein
MDEIISYKICAVKVRNAKLRNYLKEVFEKLASVCFFKLHEKPYYYLLINNIHEKIM